MKTEFKWLLWTDSNGISVKGPPPHKYQGQEVTSWKVTAGWQSASRLEMLKMLFICWADRTHKHWQKDAFTATDSWVVLLFFPLVPYDCWWCVNKAECRAALKGFAEAEWHFEPIVMVALALAQCTRYSRFHNPKVEQMKHLTRLRKENKSPKIIRFNVTIHPRFDTFYSKPVIPKWSQHNGKS